MRRLLPGILFAVLALATSCARSFEAFDASTLGDHQKRDFLFYTLPRTVVSVDLPIAKIKTTLESSQCKGSQFDAIRTELLLDAPEEGTAFKLGKLAISTRVEPDPTAVFAIDLAHRPFIKTAGSFEQTDNSLLTTASLSAEDHSLDAVLAVTKIALAATGVVTPLGVPESVKRAPTPCDAIADRIRSLREKRARVLSDATAREGASKELIDYILGQFDDAEAPLAAQFSGTTTKTLVTAHCDFRPNVWDNPAQPVALFDFDPKTGVSNTNPACEVAEVVASATGGGAKVTLSIAPDGAQFADAVSKVKRPIDASARGFFYRIPANGRISVNVDKTVKARELVQIAQLGTVNALPVVGGAFVMKAQLTPTLNASGGLSKLTINSEPSANAAITGVGDLLTSIQKSDTAKKAADAAAKDELAQLKRKRDILDQEKQIAELQKALAALNGSTP